MKKSLLSVFAVAAGLLMATTSCSKQEEVTAGSEATVSFTAQIPNGLNHRAPKALTATTTFGDGKTATKLQYAVYKVSGDTWALIDELSNETTLTDLAATVTLQLVKGNTYAVAFWADVERESIYSFNKKDCKITADYTTKTPTSSNESYDAFYAVKTFTVNGSSQETVQLTRPFAQLNIGTADLVAAKEAGYVVEKAAVTVATYNTLNLKSGDVEGTAESVTFALADLPKTATFPVDGYTYLAMNYLLMPKDKQADNTITISYDNTNVPARKFENVPLQRNYRTNIYGNLLTSTTKFNVVIKPAFDGEMGIAFSVAKDKVVAFSKGNLQYTKSANGGTWSFAENQYDMIGDANFSGNVLADKIDLFGWSCKGHEWGIDISNGFGNADFVDWGEKMEGYRTLTVDEWDYLIYSRDKASDKYGVACIKIDDTKSVNGLILLPDIWTPVDGVDFKSGCSNNTSSDEADYATHQTLTLDEWQKLEAAGAVFLPAAGRRNGTSYGETVYGCYWSSTPYIGGIISTTQSWAYNLQIAPNHDREDGKIIDGMANYISSTHWGCAVRLVQDL